ncbi:MAG TPA: VOC family protein [Gemmatimonadaceae bacterium]|nr:VOC family protein [Gemmatimonadaceae bacterium]
MNKAHGRFAWHDLNTSNPVGALAFYPPITSWTSQPMEDAADYTLWVNGGTPVGGVTPLSPALQAQGIPPHWLSYVSVYDVDESVRQVKALGGTVRMGPTEVPTVGAWAVIGDPQGATLGLFEPEGAPPVQPGQPRRGEFSWHELMTTDYKAAFEFYRALLKWEKINEFDMGPMGMYFLYGQNGQTYGGMFNRSAEMPPPNWLAYVRVDDVKAAAETVTKLGGTIMNGPMEVPGGDWIAQCMDGQGTPFALHTINAS